jgi:hypothetical protein
MPPQKRLNELDFPLPDQPASLSLLDEIEWQRCAIVLRSMANTGLGLRAELAQAISGEMGNPPHSTVIKNTFYNLVDAGLVISELAPLIGASRVTLVRLSDDGISYCNSAGWSPMENDWMALIERRNADALPQYAAWVLQFAYHARMRGWGVEVAPDDKDRDCPADLILCRSFQTPVHVVGTTKMTLGALEAIAEEYPQLNMVVSRPQHLDHMRSMFKLGDFRGTMTDLESLINQVRKGKLGNLWMETR